MPPLPPVPATLRVFLRGWTDNEHLWPWGNVLHFQYAGTVPSTSSLASMAGNFAANWNSNMAPECPSPTTLTEVTIVDLTSASSASGVWTGTYAGTRGDDSTAANAAALISYPAPIRYRGGKPRTYLYVGGKDDLEGATKWSTAFTNEFQTHWRQYLSTQLGTVIGGTNMTSFGTIRYHGKFEPNGGPPHYVLTTPIYMPLVIAQATGQQQIASQRRRIGRRSK